jgi:hypothetical protein
MVDDKNTNNLVDFLLGKKGSRRGFLTATVQAAAEKLVPFNINKFSL